jgi:hypothetical protein
MWKIVYMVTFLLRYVYIVLYSSLEYVHLLEFTLQSHSYYEKINAFGLLRICLTYCTSIEKWKTVDKHYCAL